jgi:outer membrane protein OmpA-like peptidoglycan-associated protein
MQIKNKAVVIIAVFIAFFTLFYSAGCRKKRVAAPPTPTPTSTQVPRMEKIVYTYNGVLLWMNTDGSGRETLFPGANSKWYPSVSPDGWKIIYWAQNARYYNLCSADLKSGRTSQLTFDEDTLEGDTQNFRINNAVAWSPDASFIVYSRNKDIWKITRDGLNPEALTGSHDSISPTLSKDNKLVFVKIEKESTYNLYVKDISALSQQRLTKLVDKKAGSPQFSPDGSRVVYTVTDGENVDIYMITMGTGAEEQLTFDGKSHSPSFSKDGTKIIFSSFVSDKYQPDIWIMNTDKSEKVKITKDGGVSPVWLFRVLAEPMPVNTPEEVLAAATPPENIYQQPTMPPVEGAPTAAMSPVEIPQAVEGELAVKLIKQGNKLMFYPVIHFDVGVANIKNEFYPVLDDMVKVIDKYSSPVIIEGHTDTSPIKTREYPNNQVLSEARAKAVKKYLATKGISVKRMTIKGFGESIPIAPNDTEENKYKNRRAEIHISIMTAEEAKAELEVETPTPVVTDTPVPEPTVTPTPKPKNIFEQIFKPKAKKSKAAGW